MKHQLLFTAALCISTTGVVGCADVVGADVGFPDYGVIAHRGLPGHAPEESRIGYELARDLGADWLEGDVQRTSDGVLVLMHDDDLKRVSDVSDVFADREDDNVGAFTFAELQQLDLGAPFNEAHPDKASDAFVPTRILALDELVTIAFSGDAHLPGLYLESKSPENFPGIEAEMIALLTARGFRPDRDRDLETFRLNDAVTVGRTGAKLVVQSFEPSSLAKFKEAAPDVPRALMFDGGVGEAVDEASADDVDAHLGPIGYKSFGWDISAIHAAGKLAHPWVINEGWQLDLVNGFGVDGVFTDYAERALAKQGRGDEHDVDALLAARGLR